MSPPSLAMSVGQTLLWIWLAILAAGLLAYQLARLWRKRHPRLRANKRSYSQRLRQRLAKPASTDGPKKPTTHQRKGRRRPRR